MKQYIVDAFTDKVFGGNQAAVCILDKWISDSLMQNIAKENNFSETAFAVKEESLYHLRWFTPESEIDFCGHATLATSFVLFNFYEKAAEKITFKTQVGKLTVEKNDDLYRMDFPAYHCNKIQVTDKMEEALGLRPQEAYIDRDLLLVLKNADEVKNLSPVQSKLKELKGLCIVVTAASDNQSSDCVSRVFCPELGLMEDPVTGSSHCMIVPYWCDRLKKEKLTCFQASQRSGILYAERKKDRIIISGKAVLFSKSEIFVEEKQNRDS
ncbi:MAG TPA: phenazine biosynthesis protein [Treponema sp.]|nr:phenazine biosynthesis protein [Treponema sp.]